MEEVFEKFYLQMIILGIIYIIGAVTGIVVLIKGFVQNKKNLKIAGGIVTGMAFSILLLYGCLTLYMKFIEHMMHQQGR